jgi:chloramphenicol 3-O phosphotransferase
MSTESATSSERPVEVIVLNGASSSGKTTLAVALQDMLEGSWLIFGIDTLISAIPLKLLDLHEDASNGSRPREHEVTEGGIAFGADGEITVGLEFERLESAWLKGLACIAATGTRLILDEVFLDGARSQSRLRRSLTGRNVAWIGVTCDPDVAMQRERVRGDRVVGGFERQLARVHEGVHYDLVVDTTSRPANKLARQIAAHLINSSSR